MSRTPWVCCLWRATFDLTATTLTFEGDKIYRSKDSLTWEGNVSLNVKDVDVGGQYRGDQHGFVDLGGQRLVYITRNDFDVEGQGQVGQHGCVDLGRQRFTLQ